MSEPLTLTGLQKGILMKGIVRAYPDPDNLWILLAVRMEVQVSESTRGDAYKNKVFALIQDFEAEGRIEEFIWVVVNDKPNSPYLEAIKKEFAGILGESGGQDERKTAAEDGVLHIDLTQIDSAHIFLSYFWDAPNSPNRVERSLLELPKEIEEDENPLAKARILYDWLNGSEKILSLSNQTILALALPEALSNYPWESLHLIDQKLLPLRWFKRSVAFAEPKNKPLSVLFMAAQPNGVGTKLDCEQQETKILEGTKRYPLNLLVEESGWLDELQAICHPQNDFDVLHLTGMVDSQEGKACMLTEDEFGNYCYSIAEDITTALGSPFPRLILLCAEAKYSSRQNEITTLARDLISQGAEAIVTFGDEGSEVLISRLYQDLARGETLGSAWRQIYREACRQERPLQSSFTLHLADTELLSRAFVTKERQQPQTTFELRSGFIDSAQRMKVADRDNFVGRRRQLQNCLKALKIDTDKVGVILHGMGGLGKSTIASRLICDRLPEHQPLIWSQWGQEKEKEKQKRERLNADIFLEKLSENYVYDQEDLNQYLEGRQLQKDLTNLLKKLSKRELSDRKNLLIFIFDDFEWNLEPQGGSYRIVESAANVLKALIKAITISKTRHKIIITCRYNNFDDGEILSLFYSQGLEGLSGADLQKKLRQLANFNSEQIPSEVVEKAIALANGNPRLLEDLNEKVLSLPPTEAEKLLTDYENNPEQWKSRVIWRDLYEQIDEPLAKMLSYGLIYEIPVPLRVLQVVCEDRDGQLLQRGINLGLIEESSARSLSARLYRISPILPRILNSIKLPNDDQELLKLARNAHRQINHLWGNEKNRNEERWAEIFRLAFADKGNPERFREQFTKMISVQYNEEADLAYEKELRKDKEYLMANQVQIYQKLEEYLQQQDWEKADYETALIMYQWMVMENYDDFYDLFRGVSLDVINEIDRLWMQYSKQQFGIKGQAKIYRDLGGKEGYNGEIWDRFGDRVGWKLGERWLELNEVAYRTTETNNYHLPVLMYCKAWVWTGGWVGAGCRDLFSRVET
jgi:hypothetical protein